jgi:glyoxylase-like metal-dependent hydrolase (beta-lactamase superfamily II)
VGRSGHRPGRRWWRLCRQAGQDGAEHSLGFAVDGLGAVEADEAVGEQHGESVHGGPDDELSAGARRGGQAVGVGEPVFRTVSQDHQIHQYQFANAPYLGFPSSYDVHGDGSVVVALAGGHTTGSVIVFVTLPAGQRYAFIGDVAWQLEGVHLPAERPLMMRKLADADPGQVRKDLLRVASLAGLMQVVPAHDLTAYEGIPRLAARAASAVS